MKPCFGYIRVSTQKQGEGVSLEAQKDAITAFASRNNLTITQWFEEKETAAKFGRPIFTQMLKLLKHGKAEGLVIHKIDRSARNLKDWSNISDLSDIGIDVYFATETLDFRSRGGRLTADIQAVIAADYIRNLREETKKGITGRLKQGLYPWPAPPGYLNNGRGHVKTVDPIYGPLVRELFVLYLSGDYSIRSLEAAMARRGLRNTRGKLVTHHTIEYILANPFYCGLMWNRTTNELYPGRHEPLISVAEFERIKEIKAGRYTKKVTKHQHTFRRLFHCAACSAILTGERQRQRHVYYRCHTRGCVGHAVTEAALDESLHQVLANLSLKASDVMTMRAAVDDWDFDTEVTRSLASIDLRLADARSRLTRLTDLLVEGAIDTATHHERRNAVLFDIENLTEQRAAVAAGTDDRRNREQFFEHTKSLAVLYRFATADEKRQIAEICTSNRSWDGKNLYIEPQNWLLCTLSDKGAYDCCPERSTCRTGACETGHAHSLAKLVRLLDKLVARQTSANDTSLGMPTLP